MNGDGSDTAAAVAARGRDRQASAQYLNCPRCRLSIRPRGPSLHMVHCPRCLARTRTLVELFVSTLPPERLYGDAAPSRDATRRGRAHAPKPPHGARDDGEQH